MANTKLSNTYGFEKIVQEVPLQIEEYTRDVRENVAGTREKSLYYSEMSFAGMAISIIICAVGAGIAVTPGIVLEFIPFAKGLLMPDSIWTRIIGVVILLTGIHEIGKMLFDKKISSCSKGVGKIETALKEKFNSSFENYSFDKMNEMVENYEDEELPEEDELDNKLVSLVEALFARNELMNKLTLISRIAVPSVLYIFTMIFILGRESLNASAVSLAYLLMIIFSRRVCLLLEYRTGKSIRAVMTAPMVLYGLVLYLKIKKLYPGISFLPVDMYMKLPAIVHPLASSLFIVCLLQVASLVLAVLFQDYYSEKKRLFEGVTRNKKSDKNHKKWYIYCNIALHIFLFNIYINVFYGQIKTIQNFSSAGTAIMTGIVLGLIWRILSPVWPETKAKTIRKFWGAKYSIIVSAFVFIIIATMFLLSGFVFTGYSFAALISMIISSGGMFALMVHFQK